MDIKVHLERERELFIVQNYLISLRCREAFNIRVRPLDKVRVTLQNFIRAFRSYPDAETSRLHPVCLDVLQYLAYRSLAVGDLVGQVHPILPKTLRPLANRLGGQASFFAEEEQLLRLWPVVTNASTDEGRSQPFIFLE